MSDRQRQTDEKRQLVRNRPGAGPQWVGTRRAPLHPIHRLQRQVGNARVQRMLSNENEDEGLWAHPEVGLAGGPISNQLANRIYGKLGHGAPLDPARRRELETEFGVPLEDVRIHTDEEADFLSRQISARAFTLGQDIFFSSTANAQDERVLRHEIAHVVQQQAMTPASTLTVGPAHDHFEEQAHRAESASTERATVSPQPATLQRFSWEDAYNLYSNATGALGAGAGLVAEAVGGTGRAAGLSSALGPVGLFTGAVGFGQSVDQMLNAPNRADQAVGGFESLVNAAGAFSGGVGTASLLGLGTASLNPAGAVAGSFAGGYAAGRLLDEGVGWLGRRITGNENEDYTLSGMLAGGMTRADRAISSLWRDESRPAYTQTIGWKLGEWLGI